MTKLIPGFLLKARGNEETNIWIPAKPLRVPPIIVLRNSFYDLGRLSDNTLPTWDAIDTSTLQGDSEALILDGHSYYFTVDDINGTDIQVLFQVERE